MAKIKIKHEGTPTYNLGCKYLPKRRRATLTLASLSEQLYELQCRNKAKTVDGKTVCSARNYSPCEKIPNFLKAIERKYGNKRTGGTKDNYSII